MVTLTVVVWAGLPATAAPAARASDDVTIRDFSIKASRPNVLSGDVVLHVHNVGPSTHEFNVDRTDLAGDALPLQSDGLTVNEDAPSLHRIDSIEQLDLGSRHDLTVKLKPGHYVLWCNLEGHYLGGMHYSLDVVDRRS